MKDKWFSRKSYKRCDKEMESFGDMLKCHLSCAALKLFKLDWVWTI